MSPCKKVVNERGKSTGLMMEGSAMHMSMLHQESDKQEAKNDLDDTPVQDKASAIEMSPYKMGHEDSPAEMSPYKMSHEDSPAKMGHESPAKNLNKGYGYEVPKPSVAEMGHESPATFTGMSGGSALHNTGYGDKLATKEEKEEMRKKPAGFNFLPPSNPKPRSSFKKPILDKKSPGYDAGRVLYDSDRDGDTIFNDLNQDGTMAGRFIRKLFG